MLVETGQVIEGHEDTLTRLSGTNLGLFEELQRGIIVALFQKCQAKDVAGLDYMNLDLFENLLWAQGVVNEAKFSLFEQNQSIEVLFFVEKILGLFEKFVEFVFAKKLFHYNLYGSQLCWKGLGPWGVDLV